MEKLSGGNRGYNKKTLILLDIYKFILNICSILFWIRGCSLEVGGYRRSRKATNFVENDSRAKMGISLKYGE